MDHAKKMNNLLAGKTIKRVTYMSDENLEQMDWSSRPVVIEFTDGSILIPQRDDEGNDGGSMYFQDKKDYTIIYTLR